jgi:hypothetical protein
MVWLQVVTKPNHNLPISTNNHGYGYNHWFFAIYKNILVMPYENAIPKAQIQRRIQVFLADTSTQCIVLQNNMKEYIQ